MKRKRDRGEGPPAPGGSQPLGAESQTQEEAEGSQTSGSPVSEYLGEESQPQSQSLFGSQIYASPPPGSQASQDILSFVDMEVSREAENFGGSLLEIVMEEVYPLLRDGAEEANRETIDTVLGQTPGFEPVKISPPVSPYLLVEAVGETPRASQDSSASKEEEEETYAVPEEALQFKQEVEEGRSDDEEEVDFGDEESFQEVVYIDRTVKQVAGEVLDELLDDVVGEISRENSDGLPEPQVLRWLILDDPEFAEACDAARKDLVPELKKEIRWLLKQEGMAEA